VLSLGAVAFLKHMELIHPDGDGNETKQGALRSFSENCAPDDGDKPQTATQTLLAIEKMGGKRGVLIEEALAFVIKSSFRREISN
jgi:hypothetical protein